jgi:hypothetical protein
MKALLFFGILILIFFHPVIGLLALLFLVLGLKGESSGSSSSQSDRNVVYRREVIVRETVYLSPEQVEQLHAEARARAAQGLCDVPAHQQHRPKSMSPEELQNKLVQVNFHQLN